MTTYLKTINGNYGFYHLVLCGNLGAFQNTVKLLNLVADTFNQNK